MDDTGLMQRVLDSARRHGDAEGTDKELEDLQGLFETAYALLGQAERAKFAEDSTVIDLLTEYGSDDEDAAD